MVLSSTLPFREAEEAFEETDISASWLLYFVEVELCWNVTLLFFVAFSAHPNTRIAARRGDVGIHTQRQRDAPEKTHTITLGLAKANARALP